MTNRIKRLDINAARLTPTEADLWLNVFPESVSSDTTVRGKLTGPGCSYSSTVEVVYPFREQLREYETEGTPRITVRALIPEPCFWDPISPFLYAGVLELWQGKECCQQRPITHGLRVLKRSPKGLLWNHKPLLLRGTTRLPATEGEARTLHQTGCNTLLVPRFDDTPELWDLGDRYGFLMLVRMTRREQWQAGGWRPDRPCSLGWLVTEDLWREDELLRVMVQSLPDLPFGLELLRVPDEPLPKEVAFVACPEGLLPSLAAIDRPRLILGKEWSAGEGAPPGVLGWIEDGPSLV